MMRQHLQRLKLLRGMQHCDPEVEREVLRVKRWQHQRLANTYADLAVDSRYAKATAFFLKELYGDGESATHVHNRDRDLLRMVPSMQRLLPKYAFDTVSRALELDVLAEELDRAMAEHLQGRDITPQNYADAFRAVGRKAERLRQVALMQEVGEGLDRVVKKPFIFTSLKMLRGPSKLAGLADMQQFLESGFDAFRHMKGAAFFLSTIASREAALIEALFAGKNSL